MFRLESKSLVSLHNRMVVGVTSGQTRVGAVYQRATEWVWTGRSSTMSTIRRNVYLWTHTHTHTPASSTRMSNGCFLGAALKHESTDRTSVLYMYLYKKKEVWTFGSYFSSLGTLTVWWTRCNVTCLHPEHFNQIPTEDLDTVFFWLWCTERFNVNVKTQTGKILFSFFFWEEIVIKGNNLWLCLIIYSLLCWFRVACQPTVTSKHYTVSVFRQCYNSGVTTQSTCWASAG